MRFRHQSCTSSSAQDRYLLIFQAKAATFISRQSFASLPVCSGVGFSILQQR
jgi:hypothetical protein